MPAGGWHYDALFAILSTLFICGIYLVGLVTTQTNTAPGLLSPSYALLLTGFVLLAVLSSQTVLLLAALLTGLFADGFCWRFHPTTEQPIRSALLAGSLPVVWSGLYFLTVSLTQGIGWSLPLWTGSILLAGLVGLLLSFVLRLPPNTGGQRDCG